MLIGVRIRGGWRRREGGGEHPGIYRHASRSRRQKGSQGEQGRFAQALGRRSSSRQGPEAKAEQEEPEKERECGDNGQDDAGPAGRMEAP